MDAVPPTPLFDLDPAALRCPHLTFRALRAGRPVGWSDQIEAFVVTRYDDVVHVLRQPEVFSSRLATGPLAARRLAEGLRALALEDETVRAQLLAPRPPGRTPVLLTADPPAHGRQRSLVNRAFTPRRVQRLEPAIAELAASLVERFWGDGRVELIAQFAVPLPTTVIATSLGVPIDRMDDFTRWSHDFVVAVGNHHLEPSRLGRMLRSQAEFFAYFATQIEDRRARPRDDLISDIVGARLDGEALSTEEMLSMLAQFLVAGNETTTKLIGSAVLHLVRHPDLAARLRAAPEATGPFVEEILRLEAPVQGLYRVARRDTEVGGVPIPAGACLWLVYASANRDHRRFRQPDACQPGRDGAVPHLSFGLGEHSCLGAGLARAEARLAVQVLLARLDDLALDDAALDHEPSYVLHGPRRLPLTFTARGRGGRPKGGP